MKKQSSRARAQSTPPVRHQLEHAVPTVIHNPEEDMTALGRWAHHAMLEPGRYLGWPLAIIGGLALLAVVLRLATGESSVESEVWNKLDTAKTPAERVDIAKANPKSPASTWAKLQAATEFFDQGLREMPSQRDASLTASKKALELFDEVSRDAPHDSPQARAAALGKARALELRSRDANDLDAAIKQYEKVAQDPAWKDTPEARESQAYAEALKDPKAVEFYKELYAYKAPTVTLPPEGTATIPPPGTTGASAPSVSPASDQPPTLSPDLGAIEGMLRPVVEPRAGTPAPSAQPKAGTPDAKSAPAARPAEASKDQKLPVEVFAPKAGEKK